MEGAIVGDIEVVGEDLEGEIAIAIGLRQYRMEKALTVILYLPYDEDTLPLRRWGNAYDAQEGAVRWDSVITFNPLISDRSGVILSG